MTRSAVLWFRRDLRLGDHPALAAAADAAPNTLALFVLDDALLGPCGAARRVFLAGCLAELDAALGGRLLIRRGDPETVVPSVAGQLGAGSVHISADAGPYGRGRDQRVAEALRADGVELVRTGSPYAVTPGRVRKADGGRYQVFTPFRRAWQTHGWRAPAHTDVTTTDWLDPPRDTEPDELLPDQPVPGQPVGSDVPFELPEPGESAALAAWQRFREHGLADYPGRRDRPDQQGTSRLSAYLKLGCLHPRTLLADLAATDEVYRSELAWREFYADVLWHCPRTARHNADRRFDALPVEENEPWFDAWCAGRTGYPIVDAGMRQLLAEGWMHNRVRMIVASFLVKDLHLPWWRGARHFMRHLVDGDLASNQHGWQWVAGSGTDAAPYYRIFNPTSQGERFDPDGGYVRRYVPELRDVPGRAVHQPWKLRGGPPAGYPAPIVDHAEQRAEALARYELVKAAR